MADIAFVLKILIFFINIIGIGLGIWVYSANPKARLNQIFPAITFLVLIWINFAYLARVFSYTSWSLLFIKITFASVPLFFIAFYFLAIYFIREEKRHKLLDFSIILSGLTLWFLTIFTNFIVKDITFEGLQLFLIFGGGKFIYYSVVFIHLFITVGLLFKKYFKLSSEEKLKTQYFFIGIFIFFLLNFIFNIFFPVLREETKYYQLGDYSTLILLGFTAYAIVKRELFGIKVILTQTLVLTIAVLLLVQAVISTTLFDFSWRFILFLLFLFFGYFLIQSVIREIQRRAELQRLYEQVDKLSKAKSEFISIASHQLRTPLTAIKGYISMLIEGTYGKLIGRTVLPMEKVYESNERLIKLVNDLLSVSRIEAGTLRIDLQKTSLENIIFSVVNELKIKADERGIYLKWKKPVKPLPEVTIDPDKFRQVILNIIDNSIKYTEEGGVAVAAELKKPISKLSKGSIVIKIKDTGEGMIPKDIEKVFESFSRGKAGEKHWAGGAGLGLYIARKFTEIHGGRVWVESEGEGKGSTFYIELPIK